MKYFLFIDNFRGFSDTCIPITDVNFLVGQNSTGKTSVLGLLKLFAGPALLMGSREFGDEHIGFSHFADMVSVNSADQSYFRVGFVWEHEVKKRRSAETETVVTGSLFTFIEKDGLPYLLKCTFCRGGQKISLKFGKTLIHYRSAKCTAARSAAEFISTLRSEWVNEHSSPDRGFEKLAMPRGLVGNVPILFALSLISHADEPSRRQAKNDEIILQTPNVVFPQPDLTWLAPIRTKPRRTYDELALAFSPEGAHTPYLIRKLLRSKSEAAKFKRFIDKVGAASGLFQDVRTRSFGRGATSRFELDIVIDDKAINVLNVGYGVSQSLPVIVEILARDRGDWFAIQQPEIHLHPRAQAALGDVFFEMATLERKRFLIETHSDFTIDRFRMNYKNGRTEKPDSQILFFERRDKHNVITPLPIGKAGELPVDQPPSYRDFFVREQMNLLGI
jgi:hypothetical protein